VTFKIINTLKVNNNNFKFNSDFKSYITIKRKLEKRLAFLNVEYPQKKHSKKVDHLVLGLVARQAFPTVCNVKVLAISRYKIML
jgi:hypothetical protein